MEEMFSSPPPRMEKQFSWPTFSRFIELPLLSGPLPLIVTLSAAHPKHQPEPFLSWRLALPGSAVR
jgi:hypothetical protein